MNHCFILVTVTHEFLLYAKITERSSFTQDAQSGQRAGFLFVKEVARLLQHSRLHMIVTEPFGASSGPSPLGVVVRRGAQVQLLEAVNVPGLVAVPVQHICHRSL